MGLNSRATHVCIWRHIFALLDQFDAWETRHVGLFTFPHSAKHIGLYQKYGFYAHFLTAIMSSPVSRRPNAAAAWSRFSDLNVRQQNEALLACQDITDTLYLGLDLTEEIRATQAQGLGDTVLVDGKVASGLLWFVITVHAAKLVPTLALLNSERCASERQQSRIISVCWMRARLGSRSWYAERVSRREYGATRSLSTPCLSWISN